MTESAELLKRFAEKGDETAFSELVTRYFDLVYSVALRQLNGDAHLAKDVVQIVFTDLARKAPLMSQKVVLVGWLHEATRFASSKLVRTERRREAREQKAIAMQENTEETSDWEQMRPVLDLAIGELNSADRNAVLLRFIEERGFSAIGEALGISEGAAQKRTNRALVQLRKILARRGVVVSGAGLTVLLTTGMVNAAPSGLAGAVATSSLAASKTAAAVGWFASLKLLLLTDAKVAVTAMAGCLLACGVAGVLVAVPANRGRFVPVDLSSAYTGSISSGNGIYRGGLTNLGAGQHVFGGVPFDVQGMVHLQGQSWKDHGESFPTNVPGIVVGNTARRIHVLHATSGASEPGGTKVGGLVVHYSDGEFTEIPILYGKDVLDWWDRYHEVPSNPDSVVAWKGNDAPVPNRAYNLQLFHTAFANPHPEKEIRAIDFCSSMSQCSPVMVAMTIEK